MTRARRSASVTAGAMSALIGVLLTLTPVFGQAGAQPATTLLDLSGLAAIDADRFIAVHDGKNPDENDRPRLSLLTQTHGDEGVTWQPLAIEWPQDLGPASDLESASAVPGSPHIIVAESGDDGTDFQRLFLVDFEAREDQAGEATASASIVAVARWPEPVFNVEGMGVGLVGEQLVLLYAERAEGRPRTRIQWAPLTLDPFAVGLPQAVPFRSPAARGPDDRPVVALDVASDGRIFVASAYDSGNDDGPFASSVWLAGRLGPGEDGPVVRVRETPRQVAELDGIKVESLVVAPDDDGPTILVGTDDENYGGILRPLR